MLMDRFSKFDMWLSTSTNAFSHSLFCSSTNISETIHLLNVTNSLRNRLLILPCLPAGNSQFNPMTIKRIFAFTICWLLLFVFRSKTYSTCRLTRLVIYSSGPLLEIQSVHSLSRSSHTHNAADLLHSFSAALHLHVSGDPPDSNRGARRLRPLVAYIYIDFFYLVS